MDSKVYKKTHRRIRDLNGFAAESGDPLHFMFGPERAKWCIPVDSANDDGSTGINDSRRIPLDRVMLLAQNRLVPGINLPSYISRIGECETYTSYGDLPGQGNIDTVYQVIKDGISTFYRWIEDADNDTAAYVPIRNNYVVVDGEGDVVVDSGADYTREIDVVIGNPSARRQHILAVVSGKLVHTKSGVGDSAVSKPTQSAVTTFGDTFTVPGFTVDSSGHVTSLSESTVTMPSTAASPNAPGLTRVGSLSDMHGVGTANAAGSASSGGYLLMAPADHAHSAAVLTFTNLPTGNVTYQMNSAATLDMKDTIGALPPANAQPSLAEGMFLAATVQSGQDAPSAYWTGAGQYFQQSLNASAAGSPDRVSVKPDTVYLVSADVVLTVVNPLGASATVSDIPNIYECVFSFNDSLSVSRKVLVPGYTAYSLPFRTTISCLVKTAGSQTVLVMSSQIDDNVFSVNCTRLVAQELR